MGVLLGKGQRHGEEQRSLPVTVCGGEGNLCQLVAGHGEGDFSLVAAILSPQRGVRRGQHHPRHRRPDLQPPRASTRHPRNGQRYRIAAGQRGVQGATDACTAG
jgi:hypothetical protein